jgi:hypothetical protein
MSTKSRKNNKNYVPVFLFIQNSAGKYKQHYREENKKRKSFITNEGDKQR